MLANNGHVRSEDNVLKKAEELSDLEGPVDCIKAPISRYDRGAGCVGSTTIITTLVPGAANAN